MILIDQQRSGVEKWEDAEPETEFCKQVFDLSKSGAIQTEVPQISSVCKWVHSISRETSKPKIRRVSAIC
jgi:hypothetical protein